ncbi:MAG: SpoIVB peptidase S55 domain-containing protein [Vicinamibacterales bacterium]
MSKFRVVSLALALATLGLVSLPASTTLMSLDEVRPGMTGIGRTVFDGDRREEFKVHILGVLRNVIGPQRHLILARLEGGPLERTGVMQGMSGSPVYVDGRLIGAVSYSIGAFSKEPIAGITPIAEMTETAALASRRPAVARQDLELPLTREGLAAALRKAFQRMRPFAERPGDVDALGLPVGDAGRIGALLRPIATPIVMGGFDDAAATLVGGAFADAGFLPIAAGMSNVGQDEPKRSSRTLEPGDAVGVSLITGDLEFGGTGTVTHVDGDRVYAFGHPFFNLGPTQFPMTRARVYSLLPSLMSSFKITAMGETIGTFEQDRATTIAGRLGPGPAMIPIRLSLDSERGIRKTFTFHVVNDQLFTPLLTFVTMFNTLGSYERQFGAATYTVSGKARVKGHSDVAFENLFTGDTSLSGAATYIAGPITMLLANDLEKIEIDGLDITVASAEEPRSAKLERVWLDDARPRAGRTSTLKVLTRNYRGEEQVRSLPIDIPAHAAGSLTLLVSDGASLTQWEQREVRRPMPAQSVAQMIRTFNNSRKNNRLYVRLISVGPGAVVEGESLPALPPSVLAVLEADRNGGSFVPLRNAVIGEWEIPTDVAVLGSRQLSIAVEPSR